MKMLGGKEGPSKGTENAESDASYQEMDVPF